MSTIWKPSSGRPHDVHAIRLSFKVGDIDSSRMLVCGEGGRYRHSMLLPDLARLLRTWWLEGRRQEAVLHDGLLFPGQHPREAITTGQAERSGS